VYDLALTIPPGFVTTYGTLAKAAGGGAMAARSVTSILGRAPNQGSIPYHRIVYAEGYAWSTDANRDDRIKMYAREGIIVNEKGKIEDFEEILYYFN
jgi:methylated-DNA-protein-cysteine methyltransferase-like protein